MGGKDTRLRRIEERSDLERGSAIGGAVPSSPASPSPSTSGTLAIVGQALASGKAWIGDSGGLAAETTLSGDATLSNTGAVTLATVPIAKGGTGAVTALAARTNLGVLAPVAGVPTGVPTEGVGTTRIASITRGAQVVPVPYYYAANANDAAINSWYRMDQRFAVGETAVGAFIVED